MQLSIGQKKCSCLNRASHSQRLHPQSHRRRQQRTGCQPLRAWRNDEEQCSSSGLSVSLPALLAPLGLWLASSGVADAATDFSKGSYAKESYWATLGLFVISFPGAGSALSLESCNLSCCHSPDTHLWSASPRCHAELQHLPGHCPPSFASDICQSRLI